MQTAPPQVVYVEKKSGGCLSVFKNLSYASCGIIVLCVAAIVVILVLLGLAENTATNEAIERNSDYGSADRPIPPLTWGKFKDGDVRITAINLNADEEIRSMSLLNDPDTATGNRYVLVWIEVTCRKQKCNEIELDFDLIDTTNDDWDEKVLLIRNPDLEDAVRGATMAGWQAFEFPIDAQIKTIKVKWDLETLHFAPPSS